MNGLQESLFWVSVSHWSEVAEDPVERGAWRTGLEDLEPAGLDLLRDRDHRCPHHAREPPACADATTPEIGEFLEAQGLASSSRRSRAGARRPSLSGQSPRRRGPRARRGSRRQRRRRRPACRSLIHHEIRVLWQVCHAVDVGDLAIQELTHEEVGESRMRPNSFAPLTDFGVLMSGSVWAARRRGHVATRAS